MGRVVPVIRLESNEITAMTLRSMSHNAKSEEVARASR